MAWRLHLRPFTFRYGPWCFSLDCRLVGFPSSGSSAHGLAFTLEDLGRVPGRFTRLVDENLPRIPSFLPSVFFPFDAPSSKNLLPDPLLPAFPCGFAFFFGSRRGFPCPLRSAFVVFRDLDGLLLFEPCDVFRPLTSLRFFFPFTHMIM